MSVTHIHDEHMEAENFVIARRAAAIALIEHSVRQSAGDAAIAIEAAINELRVAADTLTRIAAMGR